jgi:uncharacterized protein (DUF1499 family)
MSWLDGFTRNWANLRDDDPDPALRPLVVTRAPRDAVSWAASAIARAPRWRVVAHDDDAGTLHATHATRVWRFVDDVRLTFEPHGSGSRVVGQSRSRIGTGDLGQNARNLRGLTALLRAAEGHGDNGEFV